MEALMNILMEIDESIDWKQENSLIDDTYIYSSFCRQHFLPIS